MDIRIYYEDTDCGGVVYYANYLKYFERARTHYLEERGLSVAGLRDQGTQFVVVHAELDYRGLGQAGDSRRAAESEAARQTHPRCVTRTSTHEAVMDKLGTWLAVTGVAIGFVVLAWLLFSDNPSDKKKKKP
ncbi:MAG: acyl-CoA thioesterase [Nitrospira sp. NTP1]|nr:acyl-CoA thioesterase [Nitrospira sp. NTP1]